MLKRIFCILLAALLIVGASPVRAEAASSLKIYNYTTKKTSTYTGVKPIVTLNGERIDSASAPGLLIDGIALVPYYDIFYTSDIAADCTYDESKGKISISKYGIDIVMTVGSRKAAVNGKPVTLPAAPMRIKYVNSGKIKVLVPSRYVSQTLGLGYTWNSSINTVAIEKHSIRLSYNGNEFEYTGVQGKVTIDGTNIDLDKMPSIITNNTAMLRARKVFADSSIGAGYEYDKSSGMITLTKGDNKLSMTVGDRTAYLNGKEAIMDAAPIIVTNYEAGSSYVMVPGRFTAEGLGYDYTWNDAAKTSVITTRKDNPASDGSDTEPELGDTGTYNDPGTVLYNWEGSASSYAVSTGIHELNGSITNGGSKGLIYYASRDYSDIKNNAETFLLTASAPFGKVTSESNGKLITISAGNLSCTDQTYQMYGLSSNFVNTIGTYNNTELTGTIIELEMISADYQYDLALSPDNTMLYITVYKNCITSASAGVNDDGDYLTLNGISPLNVSISTQSGYLYLDLPEVSNSLGELTTGILGTKYIKQLYVFSSMGKTQIIMAADPGYDYYIIENGNQYTISLRAAGAGTDDGTDIPAVIDKSKYEIVIPKPQGLNNSMISDEDFYFHNYFVIRLAGDYTGFFNNSKINYTSEVIKNISVSLNGSGETEIKVASSKLQGYEIAADNDAIYVNIGDPRDIYTNIVVIDPGHGGSANGAQYYGSNEKDINLKIAYTLGDKYFNSDTLKLKVYYTRTSDVDMSLSDRAAFAKKVGADLFVSLHMNAVVDAPGVHGSEVFYSLKNNTANGSGLRSQELAKIINTSIYTNLGTTDRGVKTENYTVIYKNTVPAVLIELGFLSNPQDYALLTNEEFQNKAAKTIYDSLLKVFEEYPTGR